MPLVIQRIQYQAEGFSVVAQCQQSQTYSADLQNSLKPVQNRISNLYSRMFSVFSCTMSVFSRLSARTKAPCSTVSSNMVAALNCSLVLSPLHAAWACGCSKLLTVATIACGAQSDGLMKRASAEPEAFLFDMWFSNGWAKVEHAFDSIITFHLS